MHSEMGYFGMLKHINFIYGDKQVIAFRQSDPQEIGSVLSVIMFMHFFNTCSA